VVRQSFDGEVLAELTVREVAASQLLLPVPIGLDLVGEDRALLAAVAAEVTLPVALDVESPDAATTRDRILPDAGVHGPPAPFDVARQTDVDGEQTSHRHASEARVVHEGRPYQAIPKPFQRSRSPPGGTSSAADGESSSGRAR